MKLLFCGALGLVSILVFWQALRKARSGQYLSDTFGLWPLGIFVWGDALVLAPFWLISSGIFLGLSWMGIIRYFLLFVMIREAYEVIYWLNHQASQSSYRPPFLRDVTWLTTEQVAIMYQLMAMCLVLFAGAGLLFTYQLL